MKKQLRSRLGETGSLLLRNEQNGFSRLAVGRYIDVCLVLHGSSDVTWFRDSVTEEKIGTVMKMLSFSLGVNKSDGIRKENISGLENVEVLELKSEGRDCCDGLGVCREEAVNASDAEAGGARQEEDIYGCNKGGHRHKFM